MRRAPGIGNIFFFLKLRVVWALKICLPGTVLVFSKSCGLYNVRKAPFGLLGHIFILIKGPELLVAWSSSILELELEADFEAQKSKHAIGNGWRTFFWIEN